MIIGTPRIILRDLEPADRAVFLTYQSDPRYQGLYDLDEDPDRASELFDLFRSWQREQPRRTFQLGIFDAGTDRLCGCAGLRERPGSPWTAVLGIELAPTDWGRYRIALDAAACLITYGFDVLGLQMIVGNTSSGNRRVEKLARWFGAQIVARREGPDWMRSRGWEEVDWALTREEWQRSRSAGARFG